MSKTPKQSPAERDDLLASEYALGVLSGKKLEKVKARITEDAAFAALVEQWQTRLAPMLDEVKSVSPPAQTWQNIEKSLFAESNSGTNTTWYSRLGFWRGLSFATAGLSALLLALLTFNPNIITPSSTQFATQSATLIAALNLAKDSPTFIVEIDAQSGALDVRPVNFASEPAKVPELWVIPTDGTPRSLGVLTTDKNAAINIDQNLRSLLKSGATLAVSLEPEGGAPEGKPTGPILAIGKLEQI